MRTMRTRQHKPILHLEAPHMHLIGVMQCAEIFARAGIHHDAVLVVGYEQEVAIQVAAEADRAATPLPGRVVGAGVLENDFF